jgi:hypothetical protein
MMRRRRVKSQLPPAQRHIRGNGLATPADHSHRLDNDFSSCDEYRESPAVIEAPAESKTGGLKTNAAQIKHCKRVVLEASAAGGWSSIWEPPTETRADSRTIPRADTVKLQPRNLKSNPTESSTSQKTDRQD